jgi:RNA polymerase sigma-70 factor (ECF subfamily)
MSGNKFEALLGPNLRSVQTLVQRRLRASDHAEDIVQEILLRAFQRRDQLRVHAKFRAWLWSIALNEIRSFFRRDRRTVSLDELPNFEAPDPSMPPLVTLERMERRAWVHACMTGLQGDQAAIRLRDIEDKSVREAAAALTAPIRGKNGSLPGAAAVAQIMASGAAGRQTGVAMGRSRIEL